MKKNAGLARSHVAHKMQSGSKKEALADKLTLQEGQIKQLTDEKTAIANEKTAFTKSLEDSTRERDSLKQQLQSVSAELSSKSELLANKQGELKQKSSALEAKSEEQGPAKNIKASNFIIIVYVWFCFVFTLGETNGSL